jgi:uncharacterized protein (DUF2461 family)
MSTLTKSFLSFFSDLEANNDREWFATQKERYETQVKHPFEAFVTELIGALSKEDKRLNIDPSNLPHLSRYPFFKGQDTL